MTCLKILDNAFLYQSMSYEKKNIFHTFQPHRDFYTYKLSIEYFSDFFCVFSCSLPNIISIHFKPLKNSKLFRLIVFRT